MENEEKNLERAKELFFEKGCNLYGLALDGDLDEYKSYNISAKQEQIWSEEYYDKMQLEITRCKPIDVASSTSSLFAITRQLSKTTPEIEKNFSLVDERYDEVDTFSKLLICEQKIEIMAKVNLTQQFKYDTCVYITEKLNELLDDVSKNNIYIYMMKINNMLIWIIYQSLAKEYKEI